MTNRLEKNRERIRREAERNGTGIVVNQKYEYVVGAENAIGKRLVEFKHHGDVFHQDRFDVFDRRQAKHAVQQYLKNAGRQEKETEVLIADLQKLVNSTDQAEQSQSACLLPNILDVAELVKTNPCLRNPIIFGLLREGEICNVIAPPKTGKSWLTLDLAIAVTTGSKFLGRFETVQGNVLIIDNELHIETLAHRIPLVCDELGRKVETLEGCLSVDCLRSRLVDLVKMESFFQAIEPGQFKLIVLDAFYRFLPSGTSENDNGAMAQLYNILDCHANRLGCAFVLIHHSSKGNQSGRSVTDVGSGAGSMSRASDCHLIIREHADEGLHVLDAAVRSWAPVEPVSIRFNFPCWYPDETEPALKLRQTQSAQKSTQKDKNDLGRIREEFQDAEFTANDVRKDLGLNRDRAARLLSTSDEFEACGVRPPARANADEQKLFRLIKDSE